MYSLAIRIQRSTICWRRAVRCRPAGSPEAIYVDANNAIRELVPMVPIAHGGSGLAYLADVEVRRPARWATSTWRR